MAILVDTSRSMALKESPQSRLDKVQSTLSSGVLQRVQDRFQVRLYGFSAEPNRLENPTQLAANGPATRLGESLAGVLRETSTLPLGAVADAIGIRATLAIMGAIALLAVAVYMVIQARLTTATAQ